MEKKHGILRPLLAAFAAMLAVNAAVMKLFFNIDCFGREAILTVLQDKGAGFSELGRFIAHFVDKRLQMAGQPEDGAQESIFPGQAGELPPHGNEAEGNGHSAAAGMTAGTAGVMEAADDGKNYRVDENGIGLDNAAQPQSNSGTVDAGIAGNAGTAGNTAVAGYNGGTGEAGDAGKIEGTGQNFVIRPGDVELVEKMSLKDKLSAMAIISKVDGEIVKRACEMAKDGVTYNEFAEIGRMAEACLDDRDMEKLRDLFNRNIILLAEAGEQEGKGK